MLLSASPFLGPSYVEDLDCSPGVRGRGGAISQNAKCVGSGAQFFATRSGGHARRDRYCSSYEYRVYVQHVRMSTSQATW